MSLEPSKYQKLLHLARGGGVLQCDEDAASRRQSTKRRLHVSSRKTSRLIFIIRTDNLPSTSRVTDGPRSVCATKSPELIKRLCVARTHLARTQRYTGESIIGDGRLRRCVRARFLAEDSADTRLLDVPPGSFGRATEGDSGVGCISKGR